MIEFSQNIVCVFFIKVTKISRKKVTFREKKVKISRKTVKFKINSLTVSFYNCIYLQDFKCFPKKKHYVVTLAVKISRKKSKNFKKKVKFQEKE